MGRVANPGAPNRVSAHVLPKAQAFPDRQRNANANANGIVNGDIDSDVDEDEKTTIESGWEEEASTTVEQGEVAEKLRALGTEQPVRPVRQQVITGVTSTNATNLDEPTMDDQQANALISVITPPTRALVMARLVVTQGNDSGQELEIRPDKTYTIGRAIDNDLVLTDISVSRKHFDLRNEDGSWVVIDRGSGNGTVVNGAIEDQPFMLASGDSIEIGNTIFRFELPNSLAETPPPPVIARKSEPPPPSYEVDMEEEDEPSTVAGKPLRDSQPLPEPADPEPEPRPIVMPRPKTMPPPAPMRPRMPTAPPYSMPPQPSTTLPLPQMAARSVSPSGPILLGSGAISMPATTLPGQGIAPANHVPHFLNVQSLPSREPFSYPHGSDILAQQRPSPQQLPHHHNGLAVMSNGLARDAPATALVPPTPYHSAPVAAVYAPQPYHPPQLSRRTKMIAGGAALTLFAAIATVAIVKGAGGKQSSAAMIGSAGKPTIEPIDPKVPASKTTVVLPPKIVPPPAKVETIPPPKLVVPPPPPPLKVTTPPPPPLKVTPPPPPPPKVETPPPPPKETKVVVQPPPPKAETKRPDKPHEKVVVQPPPPKAETKPKRPDKPKRVATGGPDKAPQDTSSYKTSASNLYAQKNFSGAAELLKKAAATMSDPDDAKELTALAALYDQFGRAYNVGMAPASSSAAIREAYGALRKANGLDFNGNFKKDITDRLGEIAPKAASAFMAGKSFAEALTAVRLAESIGVNNSTTKAVRKSLNEQAQDLISQATKELDSDRADAKEKLKKAQSAVEPQNALYLKAANLLHNL